MPARRKSSTNKPNNFSQDFSQNLNYYNNSQSFDPHNTNDNYNQTYYTMPSNDYVPNNQNYYTNNAYNNQNEPYYNNQVLEYNNQQLTFEKPKRKSKLWLILVLVPFIVALSIFIAYYSNYQRVLNSVKPYEKVFAKGVSIDGIDLSGLSYQKGKQLVEAQSANKRNSWYVDVQFEGRQVVRIDSNTVGIEYHSKDALDKAFALAKNGSIYDKKQALENLEKNPQSFYSVQPEARLDAIDKILNQIKESAYMAPVNAQFVGFYPELDYPFVFNQEKYGRSIDIDSARTQIISLLQNFQQGTINLIANDLKPQITVEDLKKDYKLLNKSVTPISKDSTEQRIENIRISFEKYNGLVLKPGEKFSFNKIVGPRTRERGFLEAVEYAYGELVFGYGGGVCQASTTTYLAAVKSGLEIVKRSPHSQPVNYTELGQDATVYYINGRQIDFQFKNSTDKDIYLTAKVLADPSNKKRLICEVAMYGSGQENVSYDLYSEKSEVLPPPIEPIVVQDEYADYVTYTDEEKVVQKPKEGYVVNTYLIKKVDGVEVSKDMISQDTYKPKAKRVYVGVTERN